MKISTRARYGLRLMFNLTLYYGKGPQLLKEIAKREEISEKYLSQIIIPLKTAGLINSTRGAHGGYILGKDPKNITVKDIFEAIEGKINVVECINNQKSCSMVSSCECRDVWYKLNDSIINSLESVTLHDILSQHYKKTQESFIFAI